VAGPSSPILVLDTSLAGLSLVYQLRQRMPEERFVFFADLARAPYAYRSPERIEQFVEQIVRRVERVQPKYLLLACDICSATALPALRRQMGTIPVSGIIDPAARAAVETTGNSERPTIGIFASNWTIEHRVLERALFRRRTKCSLFFRPALALESLINEGRSVEDPLVMMACEQYLQQMLDKGCQTILLASSALATVRRTFQMLAGEDVCVVDAVRATADDVTRRVRRLRLARPPAMHANEQPILWFLTDESPEIFDRAERTAGFELPPPTIVNLDELDSPGPNPRLRSTG
jgi:glutamate racemase